MPPDDSFLEGAQVETDTQAVPQLKDLLMQLNDDRRLLRLLLGAEASQLRQWLKDEAMPATQVPRFDSARQITNVLYDKLYPSLAWSWWSGGHTAVGEDSPRQLFADEANLPQLLALARRTAFDHFTEDQAYRWALQDAELPLSYDQIVGRQIRFWDLRDDLEMVETVVAGVELRPDLRLFVGQPSFRGTSLYHLAWREGAWQALVNTVGSGMRTAYLAVVLEWVDNPGA